ncbi:MAG: DUF1553 domain-containing protein, partial [Planctomycetaceae bacterium]|nr:DUF1553 domain-containing protein [Planctomycetaceae bacterium]
DLTKYEDIRQPLMDWMRSPDNPLFSKAFVNRVWAAYFNVGIVNPSDDLNLANPPSNAPLLDYLAQEFIAHKFDMKWLHRTILNSRAYQLDWRPTDSNRSDERNFARAVPRRLPAETAWDIVSQAVSNDDAFRSYAANISDRAIGIPGAGARARNGNADYALTIFGRSTRESNCDCDRSEEPSLLQTIFLRNDGQVLSMMDDRNGWLAQVANDNGIDFRTKSPGEQERAEAAKQEQLRRTYQNRLNEQQAALMKARRKGTDEKTIARMEEKIEQLKKQWKKYLEPGSDKAADSGREELQNVSAVIETAYLRTLSRKPTPEETKTAAEYIAAAKHPVDGLRGVLWALVNTKEFIVNH